MALSEIFKNLKLELKRNIGFQTKLGLLTYRIGYIACYHTNNIILKLLLKCIYYILKIICMVFNCGSIPNPTIKIGWGLILQHGFSNTEINPKVEIGDNCIMFHNVTLGISQRGKCNVKIGNDVTIGAYSMVLGDTYIGDGCKIGARTLVLDKHIPDNSTVVNKVECTIINTSQ